MVVVACTGTSLGQFRTLGHTSFDYNSFKAYRVMGIILSCFKGIGKTYLMNTHGKNTKILDLSDYDGDDLIGAIKDGVNENDIVFVSCDTDTMDLLNENNIDYDLFYPSKERRKEFIENEVRKRTRSSEIRTLDRDFGMMIDEIEDNESENCFKHCLLNFGEFIGNSPIILSYISDLKKEEKK